MSKANGNSAAEALPGEELMMIGAIDGMLAAIGAEPEKICPACGNTFTGLRAKTRAKYCSDNCRNKYSMRKRRAAQKEANGMTAENGSAPTEPPGVTLADLVETVHALENLGIRDLSDFETELNTVVRSMLEDMVKLAKEVRYLNDLKQNSVVVKTDDGRKVKTALDLTEPMDAALGEAERLGSMAGKYLETLKEKE